MDRFPLIVSYYTKKTLYQLEVQNLIASCEKWNLSFDIEGIDSFGSWELNCGYKPFFLFRKLQELKKPILWIDADAVILKRPEVIEAFAADLAVRINEGLPIDHPSKVISSTIFVNYTPEGAELLRRWAEEGNKQLGQNERKEEFWDQIALRNVIYNQTHNAKVIGLPLEYTKISEHPFDTEAVKDPVIEHYQASRRFKKSINIH